MLRQRPALAVRPRTRRFRLELQSLEDRTAPATHVWQGASGGSWSFASNWTNGVPTTGESGGTIAQFDGNIVSTDNSPALVLNELPYTAGTHTLARTPGEPLGV